MNLVAETEIVYVFEIEKSDEEDDDETTEAINSKTKSDGQLTLCIPKTSTLELLTVHVGEKKIGFPDNKEPNYSISLNNEFQADAKVEISLKFVSLLELSRGAFEYEIPKEYYAKDVECEIRIQSRFKVNQAQYSPGFVHE